MYATRGVGLDTVAGMVERAEETVRKWLSQWRRRGLQSGVTGHAVGENAAGLKRAQKEELEEALGRPPSEADAGAGFWGARGSLRMSCRSDSASSTSPSPPTGCSCTLSGMSLKLSDPLVGRRDEEAVVRRMAEIRDQVAGLLEGGWEAWRRRGGPRRPRGRDPPHVAS